MHEFGIVDELLGQIEACCRENGGGRVTSVRVALRKGSGYEPDHLTFAFDLQKVGTLAAGAVLAVESAPGTARCVGCGHTHPAEDLPERCPRCQAGPVVWAAGPPLAVKELVIDG